MTERPSGATSPVVQASQESIDSLRASAAAWGAAFADDATERGRLATHAEAIAGVFQAFSLSFGALPRFRTEPALRRFREALQELERALRDARVAGLEPHLSDAAGAAAQASKQAEAAYTTLSGKPAEPAGVARTVRGSVQRLLSDRGYGFVRADGETSEIFFSAQGMRTGRLGDLRVGQAVSFRVAPDPRVPGRLHAVDVQPLR